MSIYLSEDGGEANDENRYEADHLRSSVERWGFIKHVHPVHSTTTSHWPVNILNHGLLKSQVIGPFYQWLDRKGWLPVSDTQSKMSLLVNLLK